MRTIRVFLLGVLLMTASSSASSVPLRVLLLSGANNHDWKTTTPALEKILESSGRFEVDITEDPSTLVADKLADYDLLLSNWTDWPDVDKRAWGPEVEKAFLDFIRSGKGFALFHAASAAFHQWPEYQSLVGGTWGEKTNHGPRHEFVVRVTNPDHPVTRGIKDFLIKDELWSRMGKPPLRNVLLRAESLEENKGSGNAEPVLYTSELGKGRCFNLVLGHDVETMENVAWKTLMLRGAEWAATGKVTIPIPEDWPSVAKEVSDPLYAWRETDTSLSLVSKGDTDTTIWGFHYEAEKTKPYFHPLSLADGTELTWLSPPDHPWHLGLWFSWKYINGLNYWEFDRKTQLSEGRTTVESVHRIPRNDGSARIRMTLQYHPPGKPSVLTEERSLLVTSPDAEGAYRIDWKSEFTPHGEVLLDRTPLEHEGGKTWGGYAGLSVRLAGESSDWNQFDSEGRSGLEETNAKQARWLSYGFNLPDGKQASVVLFDRPDNPRHPTPWYVIERPEHPFAYFSPAVLFEEPMTLAPKDRLVLRYRVLVTPNASADPNRLEAEYQNYIESEDLF